MQLAFADILFACTITVVHNGCVGITTVVDRRRRVAHISVSTIAVALVGGQRRRPPPTSEPPQHTASQQIVENRLGPRPPAAVHRHAAARRRAAKAEARVGEPVAPRVRAAHREQHTRALLQHNIVCVARVAHGDAAHCAAAAQMRLAELARVVRQQRGQARVARLKGHARTQSKALLQRSGVQRSAQRLVERH